MPMLTVSMLPLVGATASAAAAQRAERLDREGRGVLQRQGCEGGGSAEELDDIVVVETVAAVELERYDSLCEKREKKLYIVCHLLF